MSRSRKLAARPVSAEAPQLIVGGVFQGYNSFLDVAELPALTGETKQVGGSVKQSKLAITASFSEYLQSINVDSSVSYGSLGTSASAKLSYAYDLNVTEQAVYVTVYASQTLSTIQANTVALLSSVPVPGSQAELEQFFTSYGDSWVDLATTGAEYIATYTFYCQTVAESKSVQASLAANNVTLSASMDTSLTEVSKETNVRVEISQYMRGVNLTMPSDPSKIYDFATDTFMAATPDGVTVIDYTILPYEKVPALQQVFQPIAATRNLFSGTVASPNVSQQLCQLQALSSQVNTIQAVYGRYGYSGDSQLPQQAEQVNKDLQTVTQLVNQMGTDPTQTYTAPNPESLTWGTPSLSYQLRYWTPWGGTGGSPFNDTADGYCPAFVESGWAITGITLAGGSWMNWIEIIYTALDGSSITLKHGDWQTTEVTQEKRVISDPAGTSALMTQETWVTSAPGWSESNTLILNPPSEVITSIWAMWGIYLNQLSISTTNPGASLKYPPNPQSAQNTDTWNAAENQVLLAFQGHVGEYVDQLQLVYVIFSPAIWA